MFITIEGGEGAGKTTQISYLKNSLEPFYKDIIVTREPGGTETAEAMRDLFTQHKGNQWPVKAQALLMFAARNDHWEQVIKPALSRKQAVICDRFTDSTLVYQGYAGGMNLQELGTIAAIATDGQAPHMTFILDIDPRQGLKRAQNRASADEDTFEENDIAFHDKLRHGFLDIAQNDPRRCRVIDATQTEAVIAAEIFDHVRKAIQHV
jgi:dTMP kinase